MTQGTDFEPKARLRRGLRTYESHKGMKSGGFGDGGGLRHARRWTPRHSGKWKDGG